MTALRRALGLAGAPLAPLTLGLQRAREAGVILVYHRIGVEPDAAYTPLAPEEFAAHCEYYRKHFTVLPLAELVERVQKGRSLRACACLTFDDGYADFLAHAYPIMHRDGLPVTHFLVSDCLATGRPPWTYRLNRLVLAGVVEHRAAYANMGLMDAATREAELASKGREGPSNLDLPRMLTVDQVRSSFADDVAWGSHTRTHAYLDRVSPAERERELTASRAELEELIGRPVDFLAYPDGRFDADVAASAAAAGYKAAFAVGQAEVTRGASLFSLPRFDVGGHPRRLLPLEVTGVVEYARKVRQRWG
ncbi:MAG: polysaccharide deacetylase family protein [Polyangiaceae bacterium]